MVLQSLLPPSSLKWMGKPLRVEALKGESPGLYTQVCWGGDLGGFT